MRSYKLQVLDYTAGKQNHVCRGVWSSELHNQCDMVEMASIIAGFTLESAHGPHTGEAVVQAMSKGRVPMSIEALTDSYSIFSYLAAAHLKLPAEKGHILSPRIPPREDCVHAHWIIYVG